MILFQTIKLQFFAESMVFNVNCYPPEKFEDEGILDWEWCQTSWNSSLLAVLVWWSNQTTFCIYTHITSASTPAFKNIYVQKLVRVSNGSDAWSLISLSNHCGKNVELKFVDWMRRQFEFSVDSFQINLDSMPAFFEVWHIKMALDFYLTATSS